jgi:hypothetical protein
LTNTIGWKEQDTAHRGPALAAEQLVPEAVEEGLQEQQCALPQSREESSAAIAQASDASVSSNQESNSPDNADDATLKDAAVTDPAVHGQLSATATEGSPSELSSDTLPASDPSSRDTLPASDPSSRDMPLASASCEAPNADVKAIGKRAVSSPAVSSALEEASTIASAAAELFRGQMAAISSSTSWRLFYDRLFYTRVLFPPSVMRAYSGCQRIASARGVWCKSLRRAAQWSSTLFRATIVSKFG